MRTRLALVVPLVLLAAACSAPEAQDAGEPSSGAAATEPAAFQPSPEDRAAVVAALQTVFDALEAGDGAILRSVLAPDIVMRFTETRDGETVTGTATLEQLTARIEGSEVPLIERMWDPEVRVDGDLATIWTPYDFYAGTELSHCGVDTAILFRGDGGWTITDLAWTRMQPPACELHPDGPPAG